MRHPRLCAALALVTQAFAQRSTTMRKRSTDEDDQLPFVFWFEEQNAGTLTQCAPLSFNFGSFEGSVIIPSLPLYLIVTPQWTLWATDSFNQSFTWAPHYPPGTQFVISFVDSTGNSGGTTPLYTTIAPATGTATCTGNGPGGSDLAFSLSPATNPLTCNDVTANIVGGTPPYTLTVVKVADRGINFTSRQPEISWTNTLSAGGSLLFSVSDGAGDYAMTSQILYSQGGGNLSCLIIPPDQDSDHLNPKFGHRPTPVGTIVGAVLGSVAALVAIVFAVLYFRNRRANKRSSLRRPDSPTEDAEGYASHRVRSDSSVEKFGGGGAAMGLRAGSMASGSQGRGESPVETPSDYASFHLLRGERSSPTEARPNQAEALPIKGHTGPSGDTSGPDYYAAIAARAGLAGEEGSSGAGTMASTSSRYRVRQHQDGGSLSNPPPVQEEEVEVELPPQYGAFSGSAAMAEMADLAAVRPKGHSGLR